MRKQTLLQPARAAESTLETSGVTNVVARSPSRQTLELECVHRLHFGHS